MDGRKYLNVLKQAAKGWSEDRCASMGAALSYYSVFSVAPLLLIVISVAGLFLGREAAQGLIVGQINGLVGTSGAEAIQTVLQSVSEPKKGVIGTIVGLVLLLVGATTVLAELQEDLNRIWKVGDAPKPSGVWGLVRARLLSLGLIMAVGFLLLISLVVSAAIAALGEWSLGLFGAWETLAHVVNFLVSLGVVTTLFALIYRFMPQVRIQWHDVWIGALVTALLFSIGKWAIGLYIGKSAVASGFGAAGSLAVLLVWVYYSAQIFLFGAEFTWAYAHAYGSHRVRAKSAHRAHHAAGVASPQPEATSTVLPAPAVAGLALKPPAAPTTSGWPLTQAARSEAAPPATAKVKAVARNPLVRLLGIVALGATASAAAGAAWWREAPRPWMRPSRRLSGRHRPAWRAARQRPGGWLGT